jgi:predicted metalloprotease
MVRYRKPVQRSGDLVDRRGGRRTGVAIGAGGGGLALIVFLLISLLGGGGGLEGMLDALQPPDTTGAPLDPASDPDADMMDFMSVVLDDSQDLWEEVFSQSGRQYRRGKLVVFTDFTESGCGGADSRVGPHYCPLDETIYIDLDFFDVLQTRFGAAGDLAPAYVLTHEVGHHVQTVLGVSEQVRRLQQQNPSQANDLSVRMELQADCFAGVWAATVFVGTLQSGENLALDPGEIAEALEAAAAVGDDRIQPGAGPESWTHGSAAQRQRWFQTGYDSGNPAACDTFSGNS